MYINRKTGEKVEAEFDPNAGLWTVCNGVKDICIPDDIFQSQYGEAMICPNNKSCPYKNSCRFSEAHIKDDSCDSIEDKSVGVITCPDCIPYIPEEYDVDNEPTFPICGTCNAQKEQTDWWLKYKCSSCREFSPDCPYIEKKTFNETGDSPACSLFEQSQSLLLSDEEIRNILQTGGTPMDFSRAIAEAELKHLEELGIVWIKINNVEPNNFWGHLSPQLMSLSLNIVRRMRYEENYS